MKNVGEIFGNTASSGRATIQSNTGNLQLKLADPTELTLASSVELASSANQLHRTYVTNSDDELEAANSCRLDSGLGWFLNYPNN